MENMFQIYEVIGNNAGASNKARADVNVIANDIGFKTMQVHSPNTPSNIFSKIAGKMFFEHNLTKALGKLEQDCVLLVQVPFLNIANRTHKKIFKYCMSHNIKVICLIHDVNELRGTNVGNNQPFYDLLKYASAIISHNNAMTKHLVSKGINIERIINLEIFDYLLEMHKEVGTYKKQIVIGGNLDVEKVKYLKGLKRINGCKIVLYGPNYTLDDVKEKIEYRGVVSASDLPFRLNEGFGLVWDGDSIESCTGCFGNYLRYNNPHKLSMYLASGLPVIIWDQAAEASFVRENGVGITVASLLEIEEIFNNMDEEQYKEYATNVRKIQEKITNGYYARKAIFEALELI